MDKLNMGMFEATVGENISVGDVTLAPAEVEKATSILDTAGKMHAMRVLPPFINNPPFTVEFTEGEESLVLLFGRKGEGNPRVSFSFDTVDDLITILNESLKKHTDKLSLRPSPRATGQVSSLPGDVYEGR
jgi:hypothetical protein